MKKQLAIDLLIWPLCFGLLLLTSCGGTGAGSTMSSPGPTPQPGPAQSAAANNLVVMVVEENHAYEQVIGNSTMPYLNSLAQQGALATQYYADMHPSIGNYFALTTGAVQTNDNNFPGQSLRTISYVKLTRQEKPGRHMPRAFPRPVIWGPRLAITKSITIPSRTSATSSMIPTRRRRSFPSHNLRPT